MWRPFSWGWFLNSNTELQISKVSFPRSHPTVHFCQTFFVKWSEKKNNQLSSEAKCIFSNKDTKRFVNNARKCAKLTHADKISWILGLSATLYIPISLYYIWLDFKKQEKKNRQYYKGLKLKTCFQILEIQNITGCLDQTCNIKEKSFPRIQK